jgi:hypothetical protein
VTETVRTLRREVPFLAGAARAGDLEGVRYEARILRTKVVESLARDIAWALPRRVALWAFIRVCAAPGVHPDEITYESAYENWVAQS